MLVAAAVRVLSEHWARIDDRDRAKARKILRETKGLPNRMSEKQRRELVSIARRIDPLALGRDLADAAAPFRVSGLRTAGKRRK